MALTLMDAMFPGSGQYYPDTTVRGPGGSGEKKSNFPTYKGAELDIPPSYRPPKGVAAANPPRWPLPLPNPMFQPAPPGGFELMSMFASDPEGTAKALDDAGIPPPTGGMSSHPKNVFAPTGPDNPNPQQEVLPWAGQATMGAMGPGAQAPNTMSNIGNLMEKLSGVVAPNTPQTPYPATPSVNPPAPSAPMVQAPTFRADTPGGAPTPGLMSASAGSAPAPRLGGGIDTRALEAALLSGALPERAAPQPYNLPSTLGRALIGR